MQNKYVQVEPWNQQMCSRTTTTPHRHWNPNDNGIHMPFIMWFSFWSHTTVGPLSVDSELVDLTCHGSEPLSRGPPAHNHHVCAASRLQKGPGSVRKALLFFPLQKWEVTFWHLQGGFLRPGEAVHAFWSCLAVLCGSSRPGLRTHGESNPLVPNQEIKRIHCTVS